MKDLFVRNDNRTLALRPPAKDGRYAEIDVYDDLSLDGGSIVLAMKDLRKIARKIDVILRAAKRKKS